MKIPMKNQMNRYLSTVGLLVSLGCASGTAQAITLQQAVDEAVHKNPEVRQQISLWRAYQFDLKGGKAGWLPTLDLDAGIGREEIKTHNNSSDMERRELGLKLAWNLFNGFGTTNDIRRLEARKDAQALEAIATANDIALETAKAYIEVLRTQDLVALAQRNEENHRKILHQIEMRYNAGIGDEVELNQAKARLALAESNVIAAQSKLADARTRYHRLLGHKPPADMSRPQPLMQLPGTLQEAIRTGLTDHPKLRAAYADVAEAKAQHEVSKSAFYPKINAEVEKRWDENGNGVSGSRESLQTMLRMRWNLFNGFADTAKQDSTNSLYQQALEIRNNARREVIENIRYAWNALQLSQQQMAYLDRHINLTRQTLLGYRQQFSLGRRSLLDLLNTENEYNQAMIQMTNAQYDVLQAQYRLSANMGHLLKDLQIRFDVPDRGQQYVQLNTASATLPAPKTDTTAQGKTEHP